MAPANGVGVLLLHGLGATPAQGRPLAEELRALGYTVYGARLPGHGGQPADLFGQGAQDWLATTTLGLQMLTVLGLERLVVVGFSTGALVALHAAARWPGDAVQGVVLVAPPVQLVSPLRHGLQAMRVVNWLVGHTLGYILPLARHGIMPWYRLNPAYPAEQYGKVPLSAVAALTSLARRAKCAVSRLGKPYTVVHGTADPVASFAAVSDLAKATPQGRLVALPDANHDVLRTNTAQSWAHIIQAIQAVHGCTLGVAPPPTPMTKESPRDDDSPPVLA